MRLNRPWLLTLCVGVIFSGCWPSELGDVAIDFEEYQNWHLCEGTLEQARLSTGGYAAKLVGRRVVITRRLEHLDPDHDAFDDELAALSPYTTVPYMTIVGKAEKGVEMVLVVETVAADSDDDAGADEPTDDAGTSEEPPEESVSGRVPEDAVVTARYDIPFALEEGWSEVTKELPKLPFDPTVGGYEVHISIVKKGKGEAFFLSGLIIDGGKLKKGQQD